MIASLTERSRALNVTYCLFGENFIAYENYKRSYVALGVAYLANVIAIAIAITIVLPAHDSLSPYDSLPL